MDLPIVDDFRIQTPANRCSYLSDREAVLDYRIVIHLRDDEYARLLERGWRRHGLYIFRPKCPACSECRSLRVRVSDFRASKSQRRTVRKNHAISLKIQSPTITTQHLNLFNRYHADMRRRRNWPEHQVNAEEYYEAFLRGEYSFEREFLYFLDGRLIAVGLVDVTETASSSIYFFHDPAVRDLGMGTFSMIQEINYAKQVGIDHHYLGYWIRDCPSMAYKNRFQPHEILDSHVDDLSEPSWQFAQTSPKS